MPVLNWKVTPEESKLIDAIAERASIMAEKHGVDYRKVDAMMDVTACHKNGCPLKLKELAEASNGDFSHDVFGIRRHIDRRTGALGGFFLPRYWDKAAA